MHYSTRDQSTSWRQTLRKVLVPLTAGAVVLLGGAATGQTQPAGSAGDHAVSTDLGSSSRDAGSARTARTWPPTPTSVGVPAGTNLSAYRGSCQITRPNTVIDSKTINCSPLDIQTTGVVIQSSKINGAITVGAQDDADPEGNGAIRVTVLDSEIDSSVSPDLRPIAWSHFIVKRSYLHGGYSGGECHNACKIKRSYVTGSGSHASGLRILRNGKLKHNTIWCEPQPAYEAGGCSGNLVMYEEFGTPHNNVVKHNYFPAGLFWYSLKFNGEDDGRIRIIDNVFGKPREAVADDWESKPSNVWTGNRFTGGGIARP